MTDLKKLRQDIRQRRRDLDAAARRRMSEKICVEIGKSATFQAAKKIAVFLSFDGEVDLTPLIEQSLNESKQLFLPILPAKGNPLTFAWFDHDSKMVENRFGIREPEVPDGSLLDPRELDLAIVPLVAFDSACQRIGVGGGFYDRTFAFRKLADCATPKLIGVAFELQKVDHVEVQPWDVRLDTVVTENTTYIGA